MLNNPLVSIVIVNWNGHRYLKDCFDSLINQNYENYEIIFVDNGSTDNSVEFIKENYPRTIIIKNNVNLGFAEANNIGVQKSNGEYIFLLNNDAWVEKNTIQELLSTYLKVDNLGVVGCKIKNPDGTIQDLGVKIDILGYPIGINKDITDNLITDLFYVSGCALFMEKELFTQFNGFDERYFMFVEELDLCWRVKLQGYQIITNCNAEIYHYGGGSIVGGTKKNKKYVTNSNRIYLRERNTYCTLLKNLEYKNAAIRICISLLFNVSECIFFIFMLKPKVSLVYVKAWWWNVINLKTTLKSRKNIQQQRKIKDVHLNKFIHKGIVKLRLFKAIGIPEVV
ncbi:glycosyltransferase family 2 protein [Methanococcoides sp. AM1]|uniref:glycosyltransferase family 2 protein n=1 Tax=Methanococcoides sp. AM1 TaxID=1201011 RepID=UPI001438568A|nr:glycosyltransferase family 2 protein [Methanococcoides sp. AM1]